MIREINFTDISKSLKTGDLILFHGAEPSSLAIEVIEWSFWSHIGMVVMPVDMGLEGSEPLFWESTSSSDGIIDVLLNQPKADGPMLVALKDRIKVDVDNHYDTHFKVKYLSQPMDSETKKLLKETIQQLHSKSFPSDKEMLKWFTEGKIHNTPSTDPTKVFCSQLTAETLMALGYLATTYVSNGYCPKDFDETTNLPYTRAFFYYDGARFK